MGIRLDWEIESEASGAHTATEDPEVLRLRRRARMRFFFTFLVLLGIVGGIGALVIWRLQEVDVKIEQFLRDTVDAEIAALRLGDWDAFYGAQRSADPAWADNRDSKQRLYFDQIQQIKIEDNVQLTGTIRNLEIDGTRGRVLVENIIDGAPYVQTWFYWRYEDGWRHVPPDYTFWGEARQYNGDRVTVRYRALDEPFAREIGLGVEGWVEGVCTLILQCGDFPHITISVLTDDTLTIPRWSANNNWLIEVQSPFMGTTRYDQPFSGQLKADTADLIVRRLMETAGSSESPLPNTDAAFLHQSIVNWLVARFMAIGTDAYLIDSLARNYGNNSVGRLLKALQPDSSMAVLADVVGVARLDEANLDWRDFLTWRLELENILYSQTDENAYVALYDPVLDSIARSRYVEPLDSDLIPKGMVTLAALDYGSEGTPQIDATVIYTTADDTEIEGRVLFRLIDNVWKRAS